MKRKPGQQRPDPAELSGAELAAFRLLKSGGSLERIASVLGVPHGEAYQWTRNPLGVRHEPRAARRDDRPFASAVALYVG